jgi:hypothetical protein
MARPFLAPFRRLLRLAGSRWRYSTPPPHGLYFSIYISDKLFQMQTFTNIIHKKCKLFFWNQDLRFARKYKDNDRLGCDAVQLGRCLSNLSEEPAAFIEGKFGSEILVHTYKSALHPSCLIFRTLKIEAQVLFETMVYIYRNTLWHVSSFKVLIFLYYIVREVCTPESLLF